ncbi:glycosyltransferase family 8 protein [Anoxybacterium hadale]|uniref:Glycosyltransferase family 8 protein n=1 Tax=Anoxybacterium hadale TaxID=3408580 RepID=A0ACD1AFJ0_9FIRM|nr:glycosyltransferase family 8 protein [Clostridiales bacterium]
MSHNNCTELIPAFSKNNIAICLASSNEYTPFVSVVIQSMIENSSIEYNYDIIILNTNISDRNIELMGSIIANRENFSLRFVDITGYVEGLSFYTWAHFTKFTYYRLIVHDVMRNYSKVIYLDSDIIINCDIAILFETKIEGYLLAACRDTHVIGRLNNPSPNREKSYYTEKLGLKDLTSYFQCGVILFNIVEMCNKFKEGELIKEASSRELMWLDQDLLNILCQDRVKYLNNSWNVMVFNTVNDIDEYFLPEPYYEEYFTARKCPNIIHYIGRSIPCYNPHIDMNDYFWKYARKSPYYEIMISIMIDFKVAIAFNKYRKINSLKGRLKNKLIIPAVNVFLPKGTKRRASMKHFYFRLRGWE